MAFAAPIGAASPPLEVTLEVDNVFFPVPSGTFAAFGPAVDAGLVCPSGITTDETFASGFRSNRHVLFHVRKTFICDDGSGTFTTNLQAKVIFDPFEDTGPWNVLEGTGDYAKLHGSGSLVGFPTPTGVFDVFTGKVHID